MKNILTACLILISSISFAKQLNNYQEIENAINEGKTILVVTNFSKCDMAMPISGQFTPSAIMLANNAIMFSDNHFTTNNPQFKDKPVNEYVRYKLQNDAVDINFKIISLPDYSIQSSASNRCLLNQAIKFFTVQ